MRYKMEDVEKMRRDVRDILMIENGMDGRKFSDTDVEIRLQTYLLVEAEPWEVGYEANQLKRCGSGLSFVD